MNLNQVTVPSRDVARAVSFYTTLGMELIVEALPLYARFEIPDGDATFSVHQVDEMPSDPGIWVYFESDRLDAWVEELRAAGMVFAELPADKSWGWREARLRDPDGNLLVLYHAGSYRKHPPWRLD